MTREEYLRLLMIERFGAEPPWHERTERPPRRADVIRARRRRVLNAAMDDTTGRVAP